MSERKPLKLSGKMIEIKIGEELSDDLNPDFIFSTVHSALLSKAVKGEINLKDLAKKTLRDRGLDDDAKWVGFESDKPKVLRSGWCRCGNEEFGSYPEDGKCSCGIYKHHVHCKNCGGITQVG